MLRLDSSLASTSAAEYIAAACGYRNGLSNRKLAKIIGMDRGHLNRLKQKLSTYDLPNDESLTEVDALEEEEDDHVLAEEESSGSEDESTINEENRDDDYSDNEYIEINGDGAIVPEVQRTKRSQP
eukprot:gene37489-49058_t